jgi:CheY-like chemotaxis protein
MARPRTSSASRVSRALDVILVDDHRDTLLMMGELLEAQGMSVRTFETATAALAAVEERAPDVVVTDLALGAESGADLARTIRSTPATAKVALIAITGRVHPTGAVVRWFDAFLVKPLDFSGIADLVRSVADASSSARARAAKRTPR